jgi:pimeloyl-ACP methyl ester carboxylesterase
MYKKKTIRISSSDAMLTGDIYMPTKVPKKHIPKKAGRRGSMVIVETSLTMNRLGFFEEVASHFANNGFMTFAYDRRAHNDSTGVFSSQELVNDLSRILNYFSSQYGISRFGVWGFCYGGITALIAASQSERIKALCLLNTYPKFYRMRLNYLRRNKPAKFMAYKLFEILDKLHLLKIFRLYAKNIHAEPLSRGKGVRGHFGSLFHEFINGPDSLRYAPNVKQPVSFFYSEKDPVVDPAFTKQLYNACGSRQKHIICLHDDDHFFKGTRDTMLKMCTREFAKYL